MVKTLAFIAHCILPPSAAADLPDYRLKMYARYEGINFCYVWHPEEELREISHAIWVARKKKGR